VQVIPRIDDSVNANAVARGELCDQGSNRAIVLQ